MLFIVLQETAEDSLISNRNETIH